MTKKVGKKATLALLGICAIGAGLYFAPRLYAGLFNYVYPSDKNVLVNRSFEPDHFSEMGNGSVITVTVDITNNEDVDLRGFYYSNQIPNGWAVHTVSVSVNETTIVDYTYGQGSAGEVYTGFTPHRWALEMPQGDGVFSPTHSISASGGTAQIVYAMTVSGGTGSEYSFGHEAWAGWLETVPVGTAVFGYQDVLNADFTVDLYSGEAPLTVAFTDLSSGHPTVWAWDFGDGSSVGSQQHPSHIYDIPGTYTVTLTVTRTEPAESDTIVRPNYITVTAPLLQADFAAHPRFGLSPLTVAFTDLSTGDVLTRVWDFGDGGTAVLPGPTHIYNTLGHYTVTLTVQDAYGSDMLMRPRYIHVTDVVYNVYLPVVMKSYLPQRR